MKSETMTIASDYSERRMEYFERSKNANAQAFKDYRNDIMTDEDRKLADTILTHFRESYDAKVQQGVFKEMEIAEAYWSGEFENQAPDARANTNIINANIETQVAELSDQNIDIEVRPYDPSDYQYVTRARRIGDRIIDANQMPIKLQRTIRRCKKFGSGWFRVLFNPKMLEGMGCPEITSVSPANIFPDASITNIDDINKGRYLIEIFKAPLYWAEQTFGMEKASAIYPAYKPYSDTLDRLNAETVDTTGESYLHILYWCKYKKNGKEKLRLIQVSGCGIILKDSKDFEKKKDVDVFPDMEEVEYPYWVFNDMERENSVWGKTNASLLYPVQDTIDEIDNAITENARLTGNPIKMVLTGSGIDPDKIDNSAGQTVPSNVPNGLSYLNPPPMASYIIERRNQALSIERMIVSRVSDQQAGIKQHGVDTATESLALQQNAMKATDATKAVLQLVLADMLMYCIELAIMFWDKDMYFETEEDGQFDYFNPSDLARIPQMKPADDTFVKAFKQMHPELEPPEYMEEDGKYRKLRVMLNVSIGAGLPKNKSLMYNVIKETYGNQAMGIKEYREKLEEYIGLPQPKEGEEPAGMNPTNNPYDTEIPINENQSAASGGVSPAALERIERAGGKYEATK